MFFFSLPEKFNFLFFLTVLLPPAPVSRSPQSRKKGLGDVGREEESGIMKEYKVS